MTKAPKVEATSAGRTMFSLPRSRFWDVTQEHCVTSKKNGCEGDYAMFFFVIYANLLLFIHFLCIIVAVLPMLLPSLVFLMLSFKCYSSYHKILRLVLRFSSLCSWTYF